MGIWVENFLSYVPNVWKMTEDRVKKFFLTFYFDKLFQRCQ